MKVITNTWVVIINTEHRLTLKVTTAQVVETSVTVNNSVIHGTGPDHQSYSNYLWTVHHLVRCRVMACILCLVFSMLIIRWGYQLKPETQREQETKRRNKTFHLTIHSIMLGDPKLTHEKHDDIYWCDILLNSKVSSCIATRNKYTLKFIYIYLLVVEIRIFWPFWKWSLHPRFSYYLELVPACKKWRYGFYG